MSSTDLSTGQSRARCDLRPYYEGAPVTLRAPVHRRAVLVPGAGLGRLAFDIAKEGFSCQGNEFSFYMV
ncbi:hypothetical protein BC938DRAFT_474346, partial [Jimgerdemannia flammicorona]